MDKEELVGASEDLAPLRTDIEAVVERIAAAVCKDLCARGRQRSSRSLGDSALETPVEPREAAGEIQHLLRVHDKLRDVFDDFLGQAGVSKRRKKRLRPALQRIAALLQLTLARLEHLGLQRMPTPEGRVDYSRHEPVSLFRTHDLSKEGFVADVWRAGFVRDGRVVRPAKVAVFKYVPKPETTNQKEDES